MVYAAVVGRDIMGVEEDALLHYHVSVIVYTLHVGYIHLLKLVTGVDTSTRPARRSGSAGKTVKRSKRTAAAAPKSSSFCCVLFSPAAVPPSRRLRASHFGLGAIH